MRSAFSAVSGVLVFVISALATTGVTNAAACIAGLGDDPTWDTPVTLNDVHAWLPRTNGIHVWFNKYAVAPGSFGIVRIIVPRPA